MHITMAARHRVLTKALGGAVLQDLEAVMRQHPSKSTGPDMRQGSLLTLQQGRTAHTLVYTSLTHPWLDGCDPFDIRDRALRPLRPPREPILWRLPVRLGPRASELGLEEPGWNAAPSRE